ncbi:MAG: 23S rRNA (pseudouridine(1915)-N(3))-methyltransferase RlmH [Lachnospiraceae bacterium]
MKEGSSPVCHRTVCVGKLPGALFYAWTRRRVSERLSRLMPTEVVELPDEKEPANPSPALNEAVMRKEGEAILRHIPPKAYVIALCIEGRQLSSEAVAAKLERSCHAGKVISSLLLLSEGRWGCIPSVTARADLKLSMSSMTFPHQLARVMLLEQLFRAAKINAGERYHK